MEEWRGGSGGVGLSSLSVGRGSSLAVCTHLSSVGNCCVCGQPSFIGGGSSSPSRGGALSFVGWALFALGWC